MLIKIVKAKIKKNDSEREMEKDKLREQTQGCKLRLHPSWDATTASSSL